MILSEFVYESTFQSGSYISTERIKIFAKNNVGTCEISRNFSKLVWNVGKPATFCLRTQSLKQNLAYSQGTFWEIFFLVFRNFQVTLQPNRQLCSVNICTKRNAWQIKCEIVLSVPNLESTSIFHHLENYMEEKPYSCLAVK